MQWLSRHTNTIQIAIEVGCFFIGLIACEALMAVLLAGASWVDFVGCGLLYSFAVFFYLDCAARYGKPDW